MLVANDYVRDLLRRKHDQQLLARVTDGGVVTEEFYVVDEERCEIETEEDVQLCNNPLRVNVHHSNVLKIKESRAKKEMIKELNKKIIRGNIGALGEFIARIQHSASDLLSEVDYKATSSNVDNILKTVSVIAALANKAVYFLTNAEEIDAKGLKEYILVEPLYEVREQDKAKLTFPKVGTTEATDNFLSISDAARMWGIDRGRVYRKIDKESLNTRLIDNKTWISIFDMRFCFGEPPQHHHSNTRDAEEGLLEQENMQLKELSKVKDDHIQSLLLILCYLLNQDIPQRNLLSVDRGSLSDMTTDSEDAETP